MIDLHNVPEVDPGEMLARYILHGRYIRRPDRCVKPDAFIPYPWPDLSVTRHLLATATEIWQVGRGVAAASSRTLYGRCDLTAQACIAQGLRVWAAPLVGNANHAHVGQWPADKAAQKIVALELAARATFVPVDE